jgi:hypothetical protein
MRRVVLGLLAVATGLALATCPIFAHHGQVQYESKNITLHGTVTKLEWNNPHAILWLEVKNDAGKIAPWQLEILPLEGMRRAGWTRESLKPGDEVTVTGRPGKGGEHIMWLSYLLTPDGRRLSREMNKP